MKRWIAGALAALGTISAAPCAVPDLANGERLSADGVVIEMGIGHLVPTVADWNGDGKKDLIVGEFRDGAITFFPNVGTDANPKLGAGERMEAGGAPISLPAG